MGCDIHVCCERKNYEGKWINCDHFKLNPYFDSDDEEIDKWWIVPIFDDRNKWWIVPIFDDRNYSLFATLAERWQT